MPHAELAVKLQEIISLQVESGHRRDTADAAVRMTKRGL